jgi:hypothetical protein
MPTRYSGQPSYSNNYGNMYGSWEAGDVDHYVIIRKLLDYIFNVLPVFIRRWEVQTYLQKNFLP